MREDGPDVAVAPGPASVNHVAYLDACDVGESAFAEERLDLAALFVCVRLGVREEFIQEGAHGEQVDLASVTALV